MTIDFDSPFISPKAKKLVRFILESARDNARKRAPRNTVGLFENEVKVFLGVRYAFAVTTGTVALFLGLKALRIKEGDEVITNPMTNIATISAILQCRAVPVFPRVNKNGFMDAQDLAGKISPKTRAIVPVHLGGYSEDMAGILALVQGKGIAILEDACQSFGSENHVNGVWRKAGALGEIGVYSFGRPKVLTTLGGGMLVTNDENIARRIDKLSMGGSVGREALSGYNVKMDPLRAAVGLANMQDIKINMGRRKEVWDRYKEVFSLLPYAGFPSTENQRINYSSFLIHVSDTRQRQKMIHLLQSAGYPAPEGRKENQFNSYSYIIRHNDEPGIRQSIDYIYNNYLCLPTHTQLSDQQIEGMLQNFRAKNHVSADRIGIS